jgi:Interferon-induced transmembrane protein
MLIPSILVTLFCCQIGGIIAIIYAAGANSSKARGDYRRAAEQARTAKTWVFVSLGVGLVIILGYIVIVALTASQGM